MGNEDIDVAPRGRSGEVVERSSPLARGCLAVALLLVFGIVFVPLGLWATGIIFAGGR